jgi:hypothetical protein
LQGGGSARRCPGFKDTESTVTYDGDEEIDGLQCHRVKLSALLDSWKDGKGPTVLFLWISPERNYLPVRSEFYFRDQWKPGATPGEVGHAEDFRKIAPGVWFPFRVVSECNDLEAERKEGKKQLRNQRVYTVEKAELDPHYDDSLFQDIPFPDGAIVYHIENDKIVRKYVKGGQNVSPPPS